MQMIVFAPVAEDGMLGAIHAARAVHYLRVDAGLPKLGVSVMSDGISPVAREMGIQIPYLYKRIINPKLTVEAAGDMLTRVENILPTLLAVTTEVLVVGVSLCFVCCARILFEDGTEWVNNEPLFPGSLIFYDMARRRVRYVDFVKNPAHALWRKY